MRGTDLVTFMESQYGGYWSERYYSAEPDAPVQADDVTKEAERIVDTTGFRSLQIVAEKLRQRDPGPYWDEGIL